MTTYTLKQWTSKQNEELRKYEEQQHMKAMLKGTKKAWSTYRANMTKKIDKLESEYDVELNRSMVIANIW